MSLHKTDKARAELTPGSRSLGQRERTLLLLADGNKSPQDLGWMFGGEAGVLLQKLMQEGYLEKRGPSGRPAAPPAQASASPPPQPATPPPPQPAPAQRANAANADTAPTPAVAADAFEGKRSLATTRMFLFDICERMFARRDPALADRFREALRQARDREGMLAAGREMIAEIEQVAGPERADSISERIAMLLPPELVT
jgi:hypothetical protein